MVLRMTNEGFSINRTVSTGLKTTGKDNNVATTMCPILMTDEIRKGHSHGMGKVRARCCEHKVPSGEEGNTVQ